MKSFAIGVVALVVAVGCGRDEVSTVEQGVVVSITAVNPQGWNALPAYWGSDAGGGSLTFEVYGSFPRVEGMTYRPNVICDGKTWPAVVLWGYGQSQMNVSIPNVVARCIHGASQGATCKVDPHCADGSTCELGAQCPDGSTCKVDCPDGVCVSEFPAGTSCWFQFELSYFNYRLHSSVTVSNLFGPVSTVQITAAVDSSVAGETRYTLSGTIPSGTTPVVRCNDEPVDAHFVPMSANEIGFPTPAGSATCSIQLRQGPTVTSNTWTVRVGALSPALSSTGLYNYGGYQPNANRISPPLPPCQ